MLGEVAKLANGYLQWVDYKVGKPTQVIPRYMNKTHGKLVLITNIQLMFAVGHYNFRRGIAHGVTQCWYSSGQKHSKFYYRHGKISGIYKGWYENGKLSVKAYYVNGVKHGKETRWDYNGQIEYKEYYINGELEVE